MGTKSSTLQITSLLLKIARLFLDGQLVDLLDALRRHARRVFVSPQAQGMYEVLSHDVSLELRDAQGKTPIYTKRQRVRFLQDNIIAFQDQAWGDGDIFDDYRCSPGVPVDRYREGHRYRILISLRGTKNRGDIEEFHIQRRIKGGFTKPIEEFQTQLDHRTNQLIMSVIFPSNRPPKYAALIEQNSGLNTPLGPDRIAILPDGRHRIGWESTKLHQGESYIIHWGW